MIFSMSICLLACKPWACGYHYSYVLFLSFVYIYILFFIFLCFLFLCITNLPVSDIVRLPHLRSEDSQGQEKFLALSADKQTRTMTQSAQTTIPPYQP